MHHEGDKKGANINSTTQEIWEKLSDECKKCASILVRRGYRGVKDALIYAWITD